MDGTTAIPSQEARTASPAAHGSKGCLVEGCPCKDARIVSTRRARFFARLAVERGETAQRIVVPEPDWQARGGTAQLRRRGPAYVMRMRRTWDQCPGADALRADGPKGRTGLR